MERETLLQQMVLLEVVLLLMTAAETITQAQSQALPGCQSKCGDVDIPYPFGFGNENCHRDRFHVNCSNKYTPPRPFRGDFEILEINLTAGHMRVNSDLSFACYNTMGKISTGVSWSNNLSTPFTFSEERDRFFVTGCDSVGYVSDPVHQHFSTGCVSVCSSQTSIESGVCSGIGCCQTAIPKDLRYYKIGVTSFYNHTGVQGFNPCTLAFVADVKAFSFNLSYIKGAFDQNAQLPVVFDWSVENYTCENASTSTGHDYACRSNNSECFNSKNGRGYICNCSSGYEGNPYLIDGCQDIDECKHPEIYPCHGDCVNTPGNYSCTCKAGFRADNPKRDKCTADLMTAIKGRLPSPVTWAIGSVLSAFFLLAAVYGACLGYNHMKLIHHRQKFFKQNGGIFLKRQMASHRANAFSIYTLAQLEKATDNFSRERLLGEGGNGSVYKGIFKDGREIAIKREKKKQDVAAAMKNAVAENENKRNEFAGEMLILAGINHKNVVKLLGCCLEVEIPMLVYEYITNNTLSHYIHRGDTISFSEFMRIATETAKALAYLHDEIEPAIIHGDVKPSNILLDSKYKVKVADFGTSIYSDKHGYGEVGTVKGTFGYLDPEYATTGQPTDKSDVYSFGVVLMEFLSRSKEVGSLPSRFRSSDVDRLADVVHGCYLDHGRVFEQLVEVSKLAVRCVGRTGDVRPTMAELALALETIGRSVKPSGPTQRPEPLISVEEPFYDAGNDATTSSFGTESMTKPMLETRHYAR